jgi:hypothetical protein
VYESRVLRRKFGSEKEVTRGWRKMDNKELCKIIL